MEEKKPSKISEIRATALDARIIMRQIGNPGVLESLTNVKETISQVNNLIKELQTPEMVRNIENFRMISYNFNEASEKIQSTVSDLKEAGVLDKTSSLIDTAKKSLDSFSSEENKIKGQDIQKVIGSTQEMFGSIKDLVKELTLTVESSKNSETRASIDKTISGASDICKTITSA